MQSISLRKTFNLPGAPKAILLFSLVFFQFLLLITAYTVVSVGLFHSLPTFHSEFEAVQAERWRNRAAFFGRACNNNTNQFVVIDCNQTYATTQRDFLNDTLVRTFSVLSEPVSRPWTSYLLNDLLLCNDPSGLCMTTTYSLTFLFTEYPLISIVVSWLTYTCMLASVLCRWPVKYWRRIKQLVPEAKTDYMEPLQQYNDTLVQHAMNGTAFPADFMTFFPSQPGKQPDSPSLPYDLELEGEASFVSPAESEQINQAANRAYIMRQRQPHHEQPLS